MNIKKLRELAESVKGWSNCNQAWLDTSEDVPAAVVGHIDEDGNKYPVTTIDCDQYYAGEDSLQLAKFYAAANPETVIRLVYALTLAREALGNLLDLWDRTRESGALPMDYVRAKAAITAIDALKGE